MARNAPRADRTRKQTMQDNAALAATRYSQLRIVTLGAALAALLVGVVGALLITRSILAQLGAEPSDAQRVAGEIACGNLTTAVALAPGG